MCWDWWQSEQEFLTAPKADKHDVFTSTVLHRFGRYPRTTTPDPDGSTADHNAALHFLTGRYTPDTWVTQ